MTDTAYIVSRMLEYKIAIAENNGQNTLLVTLDVLKEILALLTELEAVEPKVSTAEQRCGHCNKVIEMDGWQSCPWCGKRIDWKGWWKKNGTRNQDS